jgi:hypothetical protein
VTGCAYHDNTRQEPEIGRHFLPTLVPLLMFCEEVCRRLVTCEGGVLFVVVFGLHNVSLPTTDGRYSRLKNLYLAMFLENKIWQPGFSSLIYIQYYTVASIVYAQAFRFRKYVYLFVID